MTANFTSPSGFAELPVTSPPLASEDLLLPALARRVSRRDEHRVATVSLNLTMCAVVTLGGVPLTDVDLGQLGLSMRTAWDTAANNLVRLASSDEGIRLWLRPALTASAGSWYELATAGSEATRWLAHPKTLNTLNDHLLTLFGCEPIYACTDISAHTIFIGLDGGDAPPGTISLRYRDGFPVPSGEPALHEPTRPFLLAA